MSSNAAPLRVVPAQLSFLAIYNPSLGESDETFHNQVIFYFSKAAKARARLHGKNAQAEEELREQENEKLRQVGLAQGMVGFARSFSAGAAVDSVETEKSRIVLYELEKSWWILASIDLTQLPVHSSASSNTKHGNESTSQPTVEFSSREVSPPALLIKQLIRAYRIFLLHHGASFEQLYRKSPREKFMGLLEKYWSRFANNWDVLLHGSPAVEIYGGLKLAAGGELGMGVGEEEWGSGERLVLEDYVNKTEGLVDLMVSRFGEPSPEQSPSKPTDPKKAVDALSLEPWVGSGRGPDPTDGVVFSGVGAPRTQEPTTSNRSLPPGIPPPIVKAVETSLSKASADASASNVDSKGGSEPLLASLGDTETWVKYLTLGYGTAWGTGRANDQTPTQDSVSESQDGRLTALRHVEPEPDIDVVAERLKAQIHSENHGYFAIGLKGDMDEADVDDENDDGDWNNRTVLRTVYVRLEPKAEPETPGSFDQGLHRPFIYTFLFTHRTESLTLANFYRNLHTYFSPLHRPLSSSTSPDKIAARLSAAFHPYTTSSTKSGAEADVQPIYDLAYDPRTLTVHSSLPNIPEPGTLLAEG
ncbi:hypothetical protein DM02DRAFT_504251, partial [Periconia macrospinosa]